jgi:hypothetical protein
MSVFVVLDSIELPSPPAVPALTLLVRNLLPALSAGGSRRHPAFESILSRGDMTTSAHGSISAWACATHGIERHGDWPAGALLANAPVAAGGDAPSAVGASFWVCAQPVHLAVDRDSLILQPLLQLNLNDHESRALFNTVRAHLADEQLEARHIATGLWCIGSAHGQRMLTTEPESVQGCSIDGNLPVGEDESFWQRLVTEAQMLLHEHPVNIARENRGEMPVNSIWLWGGGTLPVLEQRFDMLFTEEPVLRAAAVLAGSRMLDAPSGLTDLPEGGEALVQINLNGERDAPSLQALEKNWLAPAWSGLASGAIDALTLVLPLGATSLVICRCGPRERRRFWRRRRPITASLGRATEFVGTGSVSL